MKTLIISDIHGSFKSLEKIEKLIKIENFSQMLILGDILHHEEHFSVEDGFDRNKTIQILNSIDLPIEIVKGNCDRLNDFNNVHYKNISNWKEIKLDKRVLFMTHGHIYHEYNMPDLREGDIFAYGHSHVGEIRRVSGIILFNPGSISLPRAKSPPTCGTYEGGLLSLCKLNGDILQSLKI